MWISLLLAGGLTAARPAACQRYLVHTYSEDDGLPSSSITGAVQDATGRMWFATRAGVAVYDGVSWAVHGPAEGLPVRSQGGLAVDERGGLWSVSAIGVRVAHLAPGGGAWQPLPPVPIASALTVLSTGSLAVTLRDDGPLVAVATPRDGLFVWDGERWWTPEDGLPDRVHDVAAADGRFFVATAAGVEVFAAEGAGAAPASTALAGIDGRPTREVLALAFDGEPGRERRLWLMGRGWAGVLEAGSFRRVGGEIPEVAVRSPDRLLLEPDGRGGVIYGAPSAVFHLDPRRGIRPLDPSSGLAAVGATALARDREGDLWIGSFRGLSKIVGFRFETWDRTHGLLESEVSAVCERREGGWVLGHSTGLTFFDPQARPAVERTLELEDLSPRPPPEPETIDAGRVLDLAEDAAGGIWVAANDLGLARVELAEGAREPRVRWYYEPRFRALSSVLVDRRQNVWAASYVGVYRLDEEQDRFVAVREDRRLGVRRLFEGAGGDLYVATYANGLKVLSRGRWRSFSSDERDARNVYAVLESGGKIWVGTAAGLFELRDGALERADLDGRDVRRPVYFLTEDRKRRLWIGTDNGVLRWDGEGSSLRHFTVLDGLAGRETNRAAGRVDSRGRVWIGTDGGLTIYRPDLERERPPPRVELTEVAAEGASYPLTGPLTLPARNHDLVFRFRAISFLDEKRLTFMSRLEGFEKEWLAEYSSPRQEIRYTNLPPGSYRLLLRAANAEGVWSEAVASPRISIPRPYWQRGWFRALAIAAAAALVYLAERFRAQRRYARRLEEEVRRRTAELEEEKTARLELEREAFKVHKLESLGVLAGGIAHEFNNVLTAVLGYLELIRMAGNVAGDDAENLKEARDAAMSARALTQRLLTFSRGGMPIRQPVAVAKLVDDAVRSLDNGAGVSFRVSLPEDLWSADADAGQLQQALVHLLDNACRATPRGGTVEVLARNVVLPPGRFVALEIEDQGPGITPEHLAKIFDPYFTTRPGHIGLGLTTAYSIVRHHGGRLEVDSEPGAGTRVAIEVPAACGTKSAAPETEAEISPIGGHLLLMDDDEVVRLVTGRMLSRLGCQLELARHGEEAVELYEKARQRGEPFDAVILDLRIPGGMGGRDTLEHLQRIDPAVRAIACSGYSNDPVMARHRDYGFQAILPKPFRLDALARTLGEVLGA